MAKTRLSLVLLTTVLAVCAAVPPLHSQVNERTVYVSALDASGNPVTDLAPDEIVIREDGNRREVLRVSRATEPMDIAVLFDDSEAMARALIPIREALSRFVALMHQDNNIALIGLASRPTIFADYTHDLQRLNAGIGRIFPQTDSSMTLLDALVETSRGLERRETPRAVIVAVLTDGPESGTRDDAEIRTALKRASVAFHAVTVGNFADAAPDQLRYRTITLARGTQESGGRHDALLAATALPQALEKLARELSAQQKVVYSRPQSLIPPETLEVSLTRAGLTARGTPEREAGARP